MAEFNRFDICEAYMQLESDYNVGGLLRERPSNQRRMESIGVQLSRIGYSPGMSMGGGYYDLTDNGKEIYLCNVLKWGLPVDGEQAVRIREFFADDWLRENYPSMHAHVHAQQ